MRLALGIDPAKEWAGCFARPFPALGCPEIDSPIGVRGVAMPSLQARSNGFRIGVAMQEQGRHREPASCIEERLPLRLVGEVSVHDDPLAREQLLLGSAQALGIGPISPIGTVDVFAEGCGGVLRSGDAGKLFADNVGTNDGEVCFLRECARQR